MLKALKLGFDVANVILGAVLVSYFLLKTDGG